MSDIKEECVKQLDISQDLLLTIANKHSIPEFAKVRVFGSKENPLFVAKDIVSLTGIGINYKKRDQFIDQLERKQVVVQTDTGPKITVVFTEQGLYKVLWTNTHPMAIRFQIFMTEVMNQLRVKGGVTMTSAITGYKERISELEKLLQIEIENSDTEHEKFLEYKGKYDIAVIRSQNLVEQLESIKDQKEPPSRDVIKEVLNETIKKYGTEVYFTPVDEDNNIWSLSAKESEDSYGMYVHKGTKLSTILTSIEELGYTIKSKKIHGFDPEDIDNLTMLLWAQDLNCEI